MALPWVDPHPAFKFFINDLTNLNKSSGVWEVNFANNSVRQPVHSLQLQVEVIKLLGLNNEVMLVSDNTGKAKVSRGLNVPGEFSWLKNGAKCSIIGTILEAGKIPHIQATKISLVENKAQIELWSLEVTELRSYLSGLVMPGTE